MQKISKEVKKRMERELRQYWTNKKKLERLNVKQDNSTATRVFILCQERVQYVENVIKQLNSYELEIFNYIFKEGCNAVYLEANYRISKSTYYNVYNKAIELLLKEWGEI